MFIALGVGLIALGILCRAIWLLQPPEVAAERAIAHRKVRINNYFEARAVSTYTKESFPQDNKIDVVGINHALGGINKSHGGWTMEVQALPPNVIKGSESPIVPVMTMARVVNAPKRRRSMPEMGDNHQAARIRDRARSSSVRTTSQEDEHVIDMVEHQHIMRSRVQAMMRVASTNCDAAEAIAQRHGVVAGGVAVVRARTVSRAPKPGRNSIAAVVSNAA